MNVKTKISKILEVDPMPKLTALATKMGIKLYFVGGTLRDIFLDRQLSDFDFAVDRGAFKLAKNFADAIGGAFVKLEESPPTARIITNGKIFDFAEFRASTIEADLFCRDLTINAIAVETQSMSLIDPMGAIADLKNKIIRFPQEKVILDDPLRILRVYRFMAQLDFSPSSKTIELCKKHKEKLSSVSPERLSNELLKILAVEHSHVHLKTMAELEILQLLIPGENYNFEALRVFELRKNSEFLRSILGVRENYLAHEFIADVSRSKLIKLLLLLDGSKVGISASKRLCLGKKSVKFMRKMIESNCRFNDLLGHFPPSQNDLIELLMSSGDEWIGVILISMAMKKNGDIFALEAMISRLAKLHRTHILPATAQGNLINGDEIMEKFQLSEGILIGQIMGHIRRLQFRGEIKNRQEALGAIEKFLM